MTWRTASTTEDVSGMNLWQTAYVSPISGVITSFINNGDDEVKKYVSVDGTIIKYKKSSIPLYFQTYDYDLTQYNIWTSTDEENWTYVGVAPDGWDDSVYFNGYHYLMNASIVRTTDFTSFSSALDTSFAGSPSEYHGFTDGTILIRWCNDAVNNAPRYSTDGTTWADVSGVNTMVGVTKLGDTFLAFDYNDNKLKTSADGITFNAGYTPDASLTPNGYYGASFCQTVTISGEERTYIHLLDGGLYLAVGYITVAPTADNWTWTSVTSIDAAVTPTQYRWKVGENKMMVSFVISTGLCVDQDMNTMLTMSTGATTFPWFDQTKKKFYTLCDDGGGPAEYSFVGNTASNVTSDFSEITYQAAATSRVFTK